MTAHVSEFRKRRAVIDRAYSPIGDVGISGSEMQESPISRFPICSRSVALPTSLR